MILWRSFGFGTSKLHLRLPPPPKWFRLFSVLKRWFFCLLLLQLSVGVLCLVLVLLFCTLCPSSFAIILLGKRELVALLNCLVTVSVMRLFLAVTWVGLLCEIVVFPNHTHLPSWLQQIKSRWPTKHLQSRNLGKDTQPLEMYTLSKRFQY